MKHDHCEEREGLGKERDRERTPHVVMISPNNQTPNRLCATPRTAEETMWVIGDVTLMESKAAIDMRKPNVPVMKDPTQKDLASLVLNP